MTKSAGVEFDGISYTSKIDLQKKCRGYWRKVSLYLHILYCFKISKSQFIESAFFNALTLRFLEEAQMLLPKIKNLNVKIQSEDGSIEDEAPLHLIVKNACINPNQGWEKFLEEILLKNNNLDTSSIVISTQFIDINIDNQMGDTPLHIASSYGYVDLIEVLLEHGADINKLNHISESPLHEAAYGNHVQVVELLLKHGAKIFENSILLEICEDIIPLDKVLYSITRNQYSAKITTILLCSASIEEKNKIFIESCEEDKKENLSISQQYLTKTKSSPENRLKYGIIGAIFLTIASLYTNSLILATVTVLCILAIAVVLYTCKSNIYRQNKKNINNNENNLNNNLTSSVVEQVMTSSLAR